MNPHLLNLMVGLIYILTFGALSLFRREGLSTQFAIEVLIITVLVEGIALLTNSVVGPLLFLIFVYLITMRCRLQVDLANALSSRGRQRDAIKLLQWAMRLLPDHTTRMVIQVNMGIVQLRRKNPASAQELFEGVLKEMEESEGLGIKYEAACRFNLGLALMRQDREVEAVHQFNETSIIYPTSIYGRSAERILAEHRSQGRDKGEE